MNCDTDDFTYTCSQSTLDRSSYLIMLSLSFHYFLRYYYIVRLLSTLVLLAFLLSLLIKAKFLADVLLLLCILYYVYYYYVLLLYYYITFWKDFCNDILRNACLSVKKWKQKRYSEVCSIFCTTLYPY